MVVVVEGGAGRGSGPYMSLGSRDGLRWVPASPQALFQDLGQAIAPADRLFLPRFVWVTPARLLGLRFMSPPPGSPPRLGALFQLVYSMILSFGYARIKSKDSTLSLVCCVSLGKSLPSLCRTLLTWKPG